MAFSETFQLLLPWPDEDHIILSYAWLLFTELWLLVSFSHFINWSSCLHNSSYSSQGFVVPRCWSVCPSLDTIFSLHSSQGILMKLSSYCCPPTLFKGTIGLGSSFILSISPSVCLSVGTILSQQHLLQFSRDFDETFQLLFPRLKMIIFWRGHAVLLFTKVISLSYFCLYEVLALQDCLQFSMNLDETFQLLFPLPEEAHIIPRCTWLLFLQDLWPLVSFSHVANRNYYQYLCSSSYSFQGILMKLSRYCSIPT